MRRRRALARVWRGRARAARGRAARPELELDAGRGRAARPGRPALRGGRAAGARRRARRLAVDHGAPPGDRPLRAEPLGTAPYPAVEEDAQGAANPLLVLGRTRDGAGRVWSGPGSLCCRTARRAGCRARLSGTASCARGSVDLERLRATLLRDGRPLLRAPVGVGQRQWPTPRGRFYVRNKLVRYRSDFYGPLAFGTSARSAVLTDWPGGGFVGIHGTNQPDLIPGRVSHGTSGCATRTSSDSAACCRSEPRSQSSDADSNGPPAAARAVRGGRAAAGRRRRAAVTRRRSCGRSIRSTRLPLVSRGHGREPGPQARRCACAGRGGG